MLNPRYLNDKSVKNDDYSDATAAPHLSYYYCLRLPRVLVVLVLLLLCTAATGALVNNATTKIGVWREEKTWRGEVR